MKTFVCAGGIWSLLVLAYGTIAIADEAICARCGSPAVCRKVCRCVPDEKKIEIVCWGKKQEDFCAPGCSKPLERHCEKVCAEPSANPDEPCAKPRNMKWTLWGPPRCGKVYTKNKLMKKVVTKSVPGFKSVVEPLCETCAAQCEHSPAAQPPAPAK